MATDKKVTAGSNKAHQGASPPPLRLASLSHCEAATRRASADPPPSVCVGTDHQKIAKLDRENEVAPPPKVSPSVGKVRPLPLPPRTPTDPPPRPAAPPQAMQTARMEKNLSQKDVAQKINEKQSVLQDYESGRAIPNPQILGKLERVLGVKLRGADIGKKLEGPKKS